MLFALEYANYNEILHVYMTRNGIKEAPFNLELTKKEQKIISVFHILND